MPCLPEERGSLCARHPSRPFSGWLPPCCFWDGRMTPTLHLPGRWQGTRHPPAAPPCHMLPPSPGKPCFACLRMTLVMLLHHSSSFSMAHHPLCPWRALPWWEVTRNGAAATRSWLKVPSLGMAASSTPKRCSSSPPPSQVFIHGKRRLGQEVI